MDRTATKYVHRLVERVDAVYNYLKKPCKLPDLPPLSTRASKKEETSSKISKNKDIAPKKISPKSGKSHHYYKPDTRSDDSENNNIFDLQLGETSNRTNDSKQNKRKIIVFEKGEDGTLADVKVKYVK